MSEINLDVVKLSIGEITIECTVRSLPRILPIIENMKGLSSESKAKRKANFKSEAFLANTNQASSAPMSTNPFAKKRGPKPKNQGLLAAPLLSGQMPPPSLPKKRGRKPKSESLNINNLSTQTSILIPKKRGRKPKNLVPQTQGPEQGIQSIFKKQRRIMTKITPQPMIAAPAPMPPAPMSPAPAPAPLPNPFPSNNPL